MVVRITTLKSFLWFFAVVTSALSFPIQVYANNPYPSMIPYAIILIIVILTFINPGRSSGSDIKYPRRKNIGAMINAYIFLVLFNTGWQTAFFVIPLEQGLAALAVYLLPVVFYFYFRRSASGQEIKVVLVGIVVAGLIVGAYFAYDSYLKLALREVSDYAKEAARYSFTMSGETGGLEVSSRLLIGYRSFGLLETHAVSSGYIVLASFAALALLPRNRTVFRQAVLSVFGIMLLAGLNFTAILAFSVIVYLFEFDGKEIIHGRISGKSLGAIILFSSVFLFVSMVTLWAVGDVMSEFMLRNLSGQSDFLLGVNDKDISMGSILMKYLWNYPMHLLNYPVTFIIGDGFTSYGTAKGGDVGLIETLQRFGMPFFILIMLGYIRVIKSGLRMLNTEKGGQGFGMDDKKIVQFSICVTLLIFITEGHYTIWVSKAILPVVFFSLALFERYLPPSTTITNSVSPTVK